MRNRRTGAGAAAPAGPPELEAAELGERDEMFEEGLALFIEDHVSRFASFGTQRLLLSGIVSFVECGL